MMKASSHFYVIQWFDTTAKLEPPSGQTAAQLRLVWPKQGAKVMQGVNISSVCTKVVHIGETPPMCINFYV